LIASTSFSQTVTHKDSLSIKYNDSTISLSKSVAILVAKDLVKKDALEKEVALLKQDTTLSGEIIKAKDKQLDMYASKENVYKSTLAFHDRINDNNIKFISGQKHTIKMLKGIILALTALVIIK
jgi:hypothetical protein